MLIVWGVYENSDKVEGRGGNVLKNIFLYKKDSDKDAKGRGVMGYGNGDVSPIKIYENFEESTKEFRDKIKKEALSKLSMIEREALGL